MKASEFLELVPERVRGKLPSVLRDFAFKHPYASLVKLYYGDDSLVHYEAWLQRRTGRVEIGLHFEGEPQANAAALGQLAPFALQVQEALGPSVEAEQWTARWTRVHETLPYEMLDEAFLEVVSGRLASFISVLEPLRRQHPVV